MAAIDRSTIRGDRLPYYVMLHNLRSAHNAGSIVRLCDNFALEGVILTGFTAGPEHRGFQSAAMYSHEYTTIKRYGLPGEALQDHSAYSLMSLEVTDSSIDLADFEWPDRGILVAGSEFYGVSEELLALSMAVISIPIFGRKACLNVSNAVAIALYDLRLKSHGRER
ncbi:MAG: hypothetical protein HS115_00510 [Spirochaetales bacterium]|nr:hypothetical protein [Spirochaetales bacterium]